MELPLETFGKDLQKLAPSPARDTLERDLAAFQKSVIDKAFPTADAAQHEFVRISENYEKAVSKGKVRGKLGTVLNDLEDVVVQWIDSAGLGDDSK